MYATSRVLPARRRLVALKLRSVLHAALLGNAPHVSAMCKVVHKEPTTALEYIEQLESEVEQLHNFCETNGFNSRGTADVMGRPFDVPVDQGTDHALPASHIGR